MSSPFDPIVERIEDHPSFEGSEGLLALVIHLPEECHWGGKGVQFFTPVESAQQVGLLRHPQGTIISAHTHQLIPRTIETTQEVLVVLKGRVAVDIYNSARQPVARKVIGPKTVLVLLRGGHGFEVIEDAEMVEVKQGPYVGAHDKEWFSPR